VGAARQDDQRISKSRFDATDIVRVAAFDRTLLQLDFGSIASSAEALGPAGSVARAALYRASGFVLAHRVYLFAGMLFRREAERGGGN
jgi:hypothetical protein